jgi:hypothetical protein
MPMRRDEFDYSSGIGRVSTRNVEQAVPTYGVTWDNLSVAWDSWLLDWGS